MTGTADDATPHVKAFLDYVDGVLNDGAFVREINDEIIRVKQIEQAKVEYMTLMMELKQQRREGKEEERIESIRSLMETMKWTAKQAMDALKIPVAEQKKYAAQV